MRDFHLDENFRIDFGKKKFQKLLIQKMFFLRYKILTFFKKIRFSLLLDIIIVIVFFLWRQISRINRTLLNRIFTLTVGNVLHL